jgi:hypothetical protein
VTCQVSSQFEATPSTLVIHQTFSNRDNIFCTRAKSLNQVSNEHTSTSSTKQPVIATQETAQRHCQAVSALVCSLKHKQAPAAASKYLSERSLYLHTTHR